MTNRAYKYSRRESNPHDRSHWILNPARLPIPPLEQNGMPKIINSYELKPNLQKNNNYDLTLLKYQVPYLKS